MIGAGKAHGFSPRAFPVISETCPHPINSVFSGFNLEEALGMLAHGTELGRLDALGKMGQIFSQISNK
ncbi:MAG: hypothetical protein PHI97_22310 [Desulfobulbus sp.]|nr:hypothetical protein [Desulfobulbus sp.]